MSVKATKTVVGFSIDTAILRRLDELAAVQRVSRSSLVERLIRDGIDEQETMVKAFSNPIVREGLVKFLSNREVLKGIAGAMHEEMTQEQLLLFQQGLEFAAGSIMEERAKATDIEPALKRVSFKKRRKKKQ